MKHIIAAVLLTVLAGLGAYSFWSGMRAQQEFNDFVHTVGANPSVRVLSADFRRGWARSAGDLELEVHGEVGATFAGLLAGLGADEARPRVGFRLRHDIQHGHEPLLDWLSSGLRGVPVIARVRTAIELDNESQAEFGAVLGRVPGVDIDTVILASGVGQSQVRMRAAALHKRDAKHALQVDWHGLSGTMVFGGGFSDVTGRFQSPGLSGRGQQVALEASGLEWTFEAAPDAEYFVGDVHARLGSLQVHDAETGVTRFVLEGFEVAERSRVEAGVYGLDLTLALDTLRVRQQGYGPGYVELALGGLDADALTQIRRISARLQSTMASEQSEQVREAALAGELTALLPALLSRSPRFELVKLELNTPEGLLRADAKATVAEGVAALANPLLLLAALEAEFSAELPEALLAVLVESRARQLAGPGEGEEYEAQVAALRDAQIAELRGSGHVVCAGDSCRTRVMLRNGRITVNGIPFEGFQATAGDPTGGELSMLAPR